MATVLMLSNPHANPFFFVLAQALRDVANPVYLGGGSFKKRKAMNTKVLLPLLLLVAGTSFGKKGSSKKQKDDTITITFKKSELEAILKEETK